MQIVRRKTSLQKMFLFYFLCHCNLNLVKFPNQNKSVEKDCHPLLPWALAYGVPLPRSLTSFPTFFTSFFSASMPWPRSLFGVPLARLEAFFGLHSSKHQPHSPCLSHRKQFRIDPQRFSWDHAWGNEQYGRQEGGQVWGNSKRT